MRSTEHSSIDRHTRLCGRRRLATQCAAGKQWDKQKHFADYVFAVRKMRDDG
jgi:hypothetical protein